MKTQFVFLQDKHEPGLEPGLEPGTFRSAVHCLPVALPLLLGDGLLSAEEWHPRPGEAKRSEATRSEARRGEAKRGEARRGQARPGYARLS